MPMFPRLNVRAAWRQQTLKELDEELELSVTGQPTYTGVQVSPNSALAYSAVYACVRVRAEALAMLSLHLYQRDGEGARKATEHPLYSLLHDAPNPEMTSTQWREAQNAHLDTWGNWYSWLDIPERGRKAGYIRQIYPMKPDRVRVFRDPATRELMYEYTIENGDGTKEKRTYDRRHVLHIAGLGYDGLMGYSPISLARQAIGLGLATEEFGARFFGNGAHVGGVVTYPNAVQVDKVEAHKADLKQQYAGLAKSHSLMVLANGGEYKPINMPLEDAQLLLTRQWQLEEIARMWRVPPHFIADLSKATYSNIEQQAIEFAMYTMTPLCRKVEQALNLQLLTEDERAEGYYFEFDLNSLMRGDAKARAEFYKIMREAGAYSPNMILKKENENPRTDPGGDEFWDQGPSGQQSANKKPPDDGAEDRLQARLAPILLEAETRMAKREAQDILREAERHAKKDDMEGFSNWLNSFFVDHQAFCKRALTPYYEVLGRPEGAETAAKSHINSLKAALFGVKCDDIEGLKNALEVIA